ncbi:MAG: GIY-YIG nuclease family protein [Chromatiales bacterium]|nr:GIY-YIG nuclease family protein [Chromatiales bacterium]
MSSPWYLYIVRCADNSLYTGITTDLERRITEHNTDKKGAKYTRARRPVELIYHEPFDNRSEASIREAKIKKLTPEKKRLLIQQAI